MPCVSITAITEACGANPGGIRPFLWLIRKKDLTSIAAAVALVVSTDMVPASGKGFVKWDLDPSSPGKLDIETEGEGGNVSYKSTLTTKIPRNIAEIEAALDGALGQQLVIIAFDKAGNLRIVGDLEEGAYMTIKGSTGENAQAFAGKEVVFTLSGQIHPPYFYTGDIPVAA